MSRLHVDLNEGRTVEVGCLSCREDVTARLSIAAPFRMYVAALDCEECGDELVQFDVFSYVVAPPAYACVMCGELEAFTRFDEHEGESEPLCAGCWYKHDHQSDELYCAQQYAFYNEPEPADDPYWRKVDTEWSNVKEGFYE